MVHQSLQLRCHAGILYRNESTEDAVPHALHHRYTYLPEASRPLFLWKPVLCHCDCPHNAGSTRKNQPTEAWYLSHVLRLFHKPDTCSLPTLRFRQAVTLQFLSVHKNLHPADAAAALLPVPALLHIPDSVQSESALPNNADGRIPNHAAYSLQLLFQFHALQ